MIDKKKLQVVQDVARTVAGISIDLPRVVVLGSQSSGKSSVLEQILQRDILPRGHNLVTRCPIVITLRQSSTPQILVENTPVDPSSASTTLADAMSRRCGDNKGIVDSPISLEIHDPDSIDLVLVDLPGLTKIPVGDQPTDIERQVQSIVHKYITPHNTLILCVIPANTDIATCESLKFAKEVDPSYDRTLGVLTKIDIMDDGTDCTEILDNTHPRLRHGYVGVVNRSQQSIMKGVTIEEAVEREERWFAEHPVYKKYGDAIGSRYLLSVLGRVFVATVEREMPRISELLEKSIGEMRRQLGQLGEVMNEKGLIREYKNAIGYLVGRGSETMMTCSRVNVLKRWCGSILGLRIHVSLDTLEQTIADGDQFILLPQRAIECVIQESSGAVSRAILGISDSLFGELIMELNACTHPLYEEATLFLNRTVGEMLREQYGKFREETLNSYRLQTCCVNFDHPDFDKTSLISRMVAEKVKSNSRGWRVDTETNIFTPEFIKELSGALVYEYVGIMARDMKDITIKLVRKMFGEFVPDTVFKQLDAIENNPKIVTDNPVIKKKRSELEDGIKSLSEALSKLKSHS